MESPAYLLEDGDGTPEYLHLKHQLRRAQTPWFKGRIGPEDALLFVVDGGPHDGQYVALWPRGQSIETDVATQGYARVGVEFIGNATETFGADLARDIVGVGMSILRDVRWSG